MADKRITPNVALGGYSGKSSSSLPAVSDDNQSFFSLKALAIASAGLILGGSLLYTYYEYSKNKGRPAKKKSKEKSKKDKKDKDSAKTSASGSGESNSNDNDDESLKAPRPDDDTLTELMASQLADMQEKGIIEAEANTQVLYWLRELAKDLNKPESEVNKLQAATRVLAAQWLVLYHTVKAVKMTSNDESIKASRVAPPTDASVRLWHHEHLKDMDYAWTFLENVVVEEERQLTLFKLDIAQRLRDISKMSTIYQLLKDLPDKTPEELVATFMVAPMLGRWVDTITLGDLATQYQSMKEFHQLALQRPDIPDYAILYDAAKTLKENTPVADMAWENYDVTHIKTKLIKMEAPGVPASEGDQSDSKALPAGQCAYHRMGAVARMVSPSPVPIPLTGIASNKAMKLEGYAVVSQGGQLYKHREVYDCTREGPDSLAVGESHVWKGTFTITQEPNDAPGLNVAIKLTFSCEITMTKSDI